MNLQLTHTLNHGLDLHAGDVHLFHYDYGAQMPRSLAPKPSFHPLRSLAGNIVSCQRPHDHVWHQGLALTFAELNNANFWGGGTFVSGQGYVNRDDHGSQKHTRWLELWQRGDQCGFAHELIWRGPDDAAWLREQRHVAVPLCDSTDRAWAMRFASTLTNVSDQTLNFGSPTTRGRPNAGYGSLFWRGPRDFTGGEVRLSTGIRGQENAMGAAAAWLAFTGAHDGTQGSTTMIFADDPANPRHPNKWFVRSTPFAAVSYAFMFDELYPLETGASLPLSYDLIIADGRRDDAAVAALIARTREATHRLQNGQAVRSTSGTTGVTATSG